MAAPHNGRGREGRQAPDGPQEFARQDPGADRRSYSTLVPHLTHAIARDAYDLALWLTVKMIAGEDGHCRLGTIELAALAGMSAGKAADCRAYLLAIGALTGYIETDGVGQHTWRLSVPDLWPANAARRQTVRQSIHHMNALLSGEAKDSPDERKLSPPERKRSPGECKNNHQEEPEEEPEEAWALWDTIKNQLRLQMTRGAWDACVRDTTAAWDATARRITVTAATPASCETLSLRVRALLRRTIAAVLGAEDFELAFVAQAPVPQRA